VRSLWKEFFWLFAVTLAGISYGLISGMSPRPWAEPELPAGAIHFSDAAAMPAIWLDARTESAFSESHLPEAISIPSGDWESQLPTLMELWLEHPRPFIVYCDSQTCDTSQRVAQQLREALPDAEVYYLKGGWPQ